MADDPRECFDAATERFNRGQTVSVEQTACMAGMKSTDPYYIGSLLLRARSAERARKPGEAKQILEAALAHPRGRGDIEVFEMLARLEASQRHWAKVRSLTEQARGLRARRGSSERKAQINLSVAELQATAYRRLASREKDADTRKDLKRMAIDAYTRLFDLASESGNQAQRAEAEKRLAELKGTGASPGLFGGG